MSDINIQSELDADAKSQHDMAVAVKEMVSTKGWEIIYDDLNNLIEIYKEKIVKLDPFTEAPKIAALQRKLYGIQAFIELVETYLSIDTERGEGDSE